MENPDAATLAKQALKQILLRERVFAPHVDHEQVTEVDDVEILRTKVKRARKVVSCRSCGTKIAQGDQYEFRRIRFENRLQSVARCCSCADADKPAELK